MYFPFPVRKRLLPHLIALTAIGCVLFLSPFSYTFALDAETPNSADLVYLNSQTFSDFCEIAFPETVSGSIQIVDRETGIVMYEKNQNARVEPASTVKIMTAILAYEGIEDKDTQITVTRKVVNESTGSKLGLKIGDVYTAKDLIHAVLLCGSNDAANLLAEYLYGGDSDGFVKAMNEKAAQLGCKDTHYTNVTGLHDDAMYTTAADTMRIARYAYGLGELADWSTLASYSFAPINDPDAYRLRYNRNYFVSRAYVTSYYYRNAYGLNSGGTPQAGNCLVTSAVKNDVSYICVILDSPIGEKDEVYTYGDAAKLLDACFGNFAIAQVVDAASAIYEVPLSLCADTDHVSLYPKESIQSLLPVGFDSFNDIIFERIVYKDSYTAPVEQGDEFGDLIVRYKNDYILGHTKLVCKESFDRSSVLYLIDRVKRFVTGTFFLVTVCAAFLLFIAYTFYSLRRRRYSRYR